MTENMQHEQEEFTEQQEIQEEEQETKKERKLVVPGEVIVSGEDLLPGDFTRKEGNDIIANRYGLAELGGRVVKIIPISGVFEPRRGNNIIGRVSDLTFNGWIVDIDGPYSAFLPIMESPRFVNKNNLGDFANIGDLISAKILGVKRGGVDLTLKFRGLGKLEGGRLIKINPNKVPRVIGKEGSMINMIKNETQTEINVGQNGYIWIKGSLEAEKKAEDAIHMVVKESSSNGLTEMIEKFLKTKENK
ncbi:MAG: exosome complex RNA-binding protein Rrp4 [Candidatus Nanoarchaeia archaeon]